MFILGILCKCVTLIERMLSVHLKVLDFNVFLFIDDNMQITSRELTCADASAEFWMGDQQWPAVHLRWHLLDVVLSVYSSHLIHDYFCTAQLGSIAQHYNLNADSICHYTQHQKLCCLRRGYEDMAATCRF
ncbi:hypothetical protein [Acidocella sp.]|uniref:hypothetical protein n=1 Tax=Acidocella sp. TaxID=50710 RepID=UPI002620D1C6|nr:hypothetical protein [Acidocella sp.]